MMLNTVKKSNALINIHCNLLQSVMEGLVDGILILTPDGKWVHSNQVAHEICQQLSPAQPLANVPLPIWRVCQTLIESPNLFPRRPVIIESEIALNETQTFRIRARWLQLEDAQQPYLLVILEDYHQSLLAQAIAETQHYKLTPRQAEIWRLHRAGHTYQQIATQLWISKHTVHKHIKDIHFKQKASELEAA
jgi:DNA-binding CsgD family transcriptional regulator